MKYLFAVVGVLTILVSALVFMGAKSAVHEILACVGFLTAWTLFIGAAVLAAIDRASERAAAQVVAAIERNAERSFEALKQAGLVTRI